MFQMIVTNMDQVLYNGLNVIGGLIVNAISNPLFLLPFTPIFGAFLIIQRFYISSCRFFLITPAI
jgi:hypothetical protein